MQSRFWMAALLGFVLIAASACSSSSDNARVTDLEEELQAEQELREEAERKAAEEVEKREAEEEARKLAEAEAEEERRKAEQAEEEAERKAEEAERQAEQQIQEQAQTLEANQRAQGLLDAFGSLSATTALTSFTAPPEAAVSVATRNRLTFGPSPGQPSSTRSGFRYIKVMDTFGRTRTSAIYTDRELSRRLLDHYGAHLEGTRQINVADAGITVSNLVATNSEASLSGNGNVPRREPTTAYVSPPSLTSLPGAVHGQAGTFRCTGTDCLITLTPTYTDHDSNVDTTNELTTLAMTSTGTLVFEPGTASIPLCGDNTACAFDDTEYMVFGYWIEDPESAVGTYAVSPFAQVFEGASLATFPNSGQARYTGAAVGVYVESAPFGSTDIDKRQGEFEASVSLTADFGGTVGGWISGFRTNPRSGSAAPRTSNWRVTLADVSTAATVTASATIDGLGGSGNWAAQFVQARADAASPEPSAIVGVFNTSGPSLHIVGAFGAEQ